MNTKNVDGIEVGTPCTMSIGSDCYPGVVIKVTAKTVAVSQVETGKNRRQWPDQDFPIYLDRPVSNTSEVYYKNKFGRYQHGCTRLHIGVARYYQDPSF